MRKITKKVVLAVFSLTMVLTLAACGSSAQETDAEPVSETVSEPVKEEENTAEETEAPDAAEEEEVSDAAAQGEAVASALPETGGMPDITNAVYMADTSEEKPAALGEWMETTRYSSEDKLYHTIYARVTKVTSFTEDEAYVKSCIDDHNSVSYDFQQIDLEELNLPSDVEVCIVDYEVYIPADFPIADYGTSSADISLSASNIGGGGIPNADNTAVYIGMGLADGLNIVKDQMYFPDNTYSFRSYFAMVKGYENYVFKSTSHPAGESSDVDSLTYCHWASR